MTEKSVYARKARWMPYLMVPVFILGAFLIYQRLAYESRDFYDEYYRPYPIAHTLENNPELIKGISALKAKDYILADEALSAAFSSNQDPELGIQLAMARMGEEKYWEAIDILQAIKEASSEHVQVAEWYKILSLIGLKRKEEAIALLVYYCEQPHFNFKMKDFTKT